METSSFDSINLDNPKPRNNKMPVNKCDRLISIVGITIGVILTISIFFVESQNSKRSDDLMEVQVQLLQQLRDLSTTNNAINSGTNEITKSMLMVANLTNINTNAILNVNTLINENNQRISDLMVINNNINTNGQETLQAILDVNHATNNSTESLIGINELIRENNVEILLLTDATLKNNLILKNISNSSLNSLIYQSNNLDRLSELSSRGNDQVSNLQNLTEKMVDLNDKISISNNEIQSLNSASLMKSISGLWYHAYINKGGKYLCDFQFTLKNHSVDGSYNHLAVTDNYEPKDRNFTFEINGANETLPCVYAPFQDMDIRMCFSSTHACLHRSLALTSPDDETCVLLGNSYTSEGYGLKINCYDFVL